MLLVLKQLKTQVVKNNNRKKIVLQMTLIMLDLVFPFSELQNYVKNNN